MKQISKSCPVNGQPATRLLAACRTLGLAHRKCDLPRDHITLELDLPEILSRAKIAYRALVRQHHVDVGGLAESHRAVVAAYHRVKTLCDPQHKLRLPQKTKRTENVNLKKQAAVHAFWDKQTEARREEHGRQIREGKQKGK